MQYAHLYFTIVFSGKPVLHLQKTTVQFRGPTQSLASRISTGQAYSTQAAEDKKEETLHSIISNTEAVQGEPGGPLLCSPWLYLLWPAPSGGHPRSCQPVIMTDMVVH